MLLLSGAVSVPFGGLKNSGLGREGGMHSLRFFSEDKNIYIDLSIYIFTLRKAQACFG